MYMEDRVTRTRREYAERMLNEQAQAADRQVLELTAHDLKFADVFTLAGYGLLFVRRQPTFTVTPTHTQIHVEAYHFDGIKSDPSVLTITTSTDCPVRVARFLITEGA